MSLFTQQMYICSVDLTDGTSGVQARLMQAPGDSEVEGRVLIGLGGAWGSICYSGWGLQDANVVCRHLGYTSAISASSDNIAGSWPGRVWLQDLQCRGNESSILNCSHPGWGVSTRCTSRNRYRFARVVCSSEYSLDYVAIDEAQHVLFMYMQT